jgi:hypothetical protein
MRTKLADSREAATSPPPWHPATPSTVLRVLSCGPEWAGAESGEHKVTSLSGRLGGMKAFNDFAVAMSAWVSASSLYVLGRLIWVLQRPQMWILIRFGPGWMISLSLVATGLLLALRLLGFFLVPFVWILSPLWVQGLGTVEAWFRRSREVRGTRGRDRVGRWWSLIVFLVTGALGLLELSVLWILSPFILLECLIWGRFVSQGFFAGQSERAERSRKKSWIRIAELEKKVNKEKAQKTTAEDELTRIRRRADGQRTNKLSKEMSRVKDDLQRLAREADRDRGQYQQRVAELEAERDQAKADLEQILNEVLSSGMSLESSRSASVLTRDLVGERVLLVGGSEDKVDRILDHIRERGATAFHENKSAAKKKARSATIVICWVKFLSHDVYYAVKSVCDDQSRVMVHWNESSTASLDQVISIALDKRMGQDLK